MSERTLRAAVGVAGVAVLVAATAVARADGSEQRTTSEAAGRLTVTSTAGPGRVQPGGAVTGRLEIANAGPTARRVTDVGFAPTTSDDCAPTGLVLAATVAPTPESPLVVPAGGTAVLGWTGYMDGEGHDDCQGATVSSAVTLDGERAGTVTLTAGELARPPAPVGGLTTSSRAAVRWSASTAADPGWVLERAAAGTDDWQPACGSSAPRPLRAHSCTDTGLARSTSYTYRLTLRTGHWHTTSLPSGPITTRERPSG